MSLGKNIAYLRKEKGWTQAELGEILGVSNQAVSKWESEMSMPDVMLLPEIAKTLGVSIESLYDGGDKEQSIMEKTMDTFSKIEDNRVLVISVENKGAVVKTRLPVSVIRALLANDKVAEEIDLDNEESAMLYGVLDSAKGELVNVEKGNKKTRITVEDYEA